MLILLMLLTLAKNPLLTVTPAQGFGPVRIYSVRYPEKSDTDWEIVAVDEGFVLRRYAVSVEGMDGDRIINLNWSFSKGSYIISSCVFPGEKCTTKNIEVK